MRFNKVALVCAALTAAVCGTPLGVCNAARADSADPSVGLPPRLPAVKVIIGGRVVQIYASLRRGFSSQPPDDPNQSISATISASTTDPRGLPTALILRSFRAVKGRQSWTSNLTPVSTFRYDPQSSTSVAGGGPSWNDGSQATVTVDMKYGPRTIRVTLWKVPVVGPTS